MIAFKGELMILISGGFFKGVLGLPLFTVIWMELGMGVMDWGR